MLLHFLYNYVVNLVVFQFECIYFIKYLHLYFGKDYFVLLEKKLKNLNIFHQN